MDPIVAIFEILVSNRMQRNNRQILLQSVWQLATIVAIKMHKIFRFATHVAAYLVCSMYVYECDIQCFEFVSPNIPNICRCVQMSTKWQRTTNITWTMQITIQLEINRKWKFKCELTFTMLEMWERDICECVLFGMHNYANAAKAFDSFWPT